MSFLEKFTKSANVEWFIQLLSSWKLWLIGAAIGAVLGLGFKLIFPGDYQAIASVLIDHNIEQVLPIGYDSDTFLYFSRETRKLEAFAWSDDVIEQITETNGGYTLQELREEYLYLAPPGDGEWNFVAYHPEAKEAEKLAVIWAQSFENLMSESVEFSSELEEIRAALIIEAEKEEKDWEVIQGHLDMYFEIMKTTSGISPYLEFELFRIDDVQAELVVSNASAMLIGSVLGFAVIFLLRLVNFTGAD